MKTLLFFLLPLALCAQTPTADRAAQSTTLAAIRAIHAPLVPGRDFTLAADGAIATWTAPARFARPTPEQLAAATQAAADRAAARAAIAAQLVPLRDALRAEMAKLSPGEQALYKPAIDGVTAMLAAGNLVEARKIIFLSAVPTAELAAARERMLSIIPEP